MNLGVWALEKKTVNLVLTLMMGVGGVLAYQGLGRLEDPEFTIKQALVTTPYPGASADEVDEEVTRVIDKACQEMGEIKRLESRSLRGLSIVQVFIKDEYDKPRLPQVWDVLRKKIVEAQSQLPPGAGPTSVNDDFGDVYGVYYAITGEGYSYRELKDYVDFLRRELQQVQDVKRVTLWGTQPQAVYVEMQRERMAQLGITQEEIFTKLEARNLARDGGRVGVGDLWVPLSPTGTFTDPKQFEELLISEPGSDQIIYLGDVAEVRRAYVDPPENIQRTSFKRVFRDGEVIQSEEELPEGGIEDPSVQVFEAQGVPSIGIAISTVAGGNVVTMGRAIEKRLAELEYLKPVGMDMHVIALQSEAVTKAINGFIVNLVEAIIIVVLVLLVFMGLKSGLLIGFILFITIVGTFILMDFKGVLLERISLGALIIALGMLVDNAIVVTEGMKLRLEGGMDKLKAAKEVVGQNSIPLLGATFVAVLAFAPIGLSAHDTGEYCRSLFFVLMFSLLLSWFTAVTTTPLFCSMIFKPKKRKEGEAEKDPYAGGVFRLYRSVLEFLMRLRYPVILLVYAAFAVAILAFGSLPPGFFPSSARPQYFVDIWMPEGSHIRSTASVADRLEKLTMESGNTKSIATHVGAGGARFLLVYNPEQQNTAYAQLLVNVYDSTKIDADIEALEKFATDNFPEAIIYGRKFKLGPGVGGNIQLRLLGPDRNELRGLEDEFRSLMLKDPHVKYVRSDWQAPVPTVQPVLAASQARRNGIDRPQVAAVLQGSYQGYQVGTFREGTTSEEDRVIPVYARAPADERGTIESVKDLQIYSPAGDKMIPLRQVVERFDSGFENGNVRRRNRRLCITLHADQTVGESAETWQRLAPRVQEKMEELHAAGLSREYFFEWGPEYEDSAEATAA
ncbi:MAG: efflux RND transporter permease subunit, partial [Planctomycetota bacterium]